MKNQESKQKEGGENFTALFLSKSSNRSALAE